MQPLADFACSASAFRLKASGVPMPLSPIWKVQKPGRKDRRCSQFLRRKVHIDTIAAIARTFFLPQTDLIILISQLPPSLVVVGGDDVGDAREVLQASIRGPGVKTANDKKNPLPC